MRMIALPAAMVAAIALSSMAFAATSTEGTVKSFDAKTMMLTLDNGVTYQLPKAWKDPGLKVGEKVAVNWEKKGKIHEATGVTIVK